MDMTRRQVLLITSMLGTLAMLGPVGVDMFVAFIPKIATAMSTDPKAVAQTVPAFIIGNAFGLLFHGVMSDRFGRKPVIIVILVLFAATAVGAANSTSVETLIFWRFLQGIVTSGGRVLANSVARDLFDRVRLAKIMSDVMYVSAIGAIIFPTLGGQLAQFAPWQVGFAVMCGFGLIVSAWFIFGFKETINVLDQNALNPATLWSNTREIVRNRTFLLHLAITSFSLSGFVAFLSSSSTVLIASFGVSAGTFGLLFSAVSGSFAAATFMCGRIVIRTGLNLLVGLGVALCLLGGLAVATLALMGLDTAWAVIVPTCIYIIGMALVIPQSTAAGLQPFPTTAGLASSILGFANAVCGAALSFGMLSAFDNSNAIPLGITLSITGLGCTLVFFLGVLPSLRDERPR